MSELIKQLIEEAKGFDNISEKEIQKIKDNAPVHNRTIVVGFINGLKNLEIRR